MIQKHLRPIGVSIGIGELVLSLVLIAANGYADVQAYDWPYTRNILLLSLALSVSGFASSMIALQDEEEDIKWQAILWIHGIAWGVVSIMIVLGGRV